MKPVIRAAVDTGRPPLELLLEQPDRPWTKWDYRLIKGLYRSELFEVEGHPVWVEESPDIVFEARRKKIRSMAVVEAAQDTHGNKKHPEKGVRFYAEAKLKPGAKWPTYKDWAERRAGKADLHETGNDKKRVSEAEARAKAKVDADPELARIVAEAEAKLKARGK